MNCCYAVLNCPTTYKDFLGSNYLSTTFVDPQLSDCPNGHKTFLSKKDPLKSWEYTCWSCGKNKYFDNEHGVGVCSEQESIICPGCMGASVPSFTQITDNFNMAVHLSESSAEQIPFCNCKRPFKKVYASRMLKYDELS